MFGYVDDLRAFGLPVVFSRRHQSGDYYAVPAMFIPYGRCWLGVAGSVLTHFVFNGQPIPPFQQFPTVNDWLVPPFANGYWAAAHLI